ncbi:MAG TPA: SDR family oxidoreductase [Methylomirabilota bacterium]|jgi:NAD(P)-dependent dehydrogenase (short-subunit alcohol dehydrogenase family)
MPLPEFDLSGKVAFVTGAGRGIGKGIAQALAEAGADVVINSLTDKHVTGLASDIAKATGRRVVPLVADVTKSDEVERAIDRIIKDFGALHVLVNNLGDSIRKPLVPLPGQEGKANGPLTDEEYRLILDLNLTEAVLCTRAVGPHMLARRSGKIINIGSFASTRGGVELTIYAAAKTALVGFTRALALEWAPYRIQVNTIAPGLFPDAVTAGDAGYAERVRNATKTVPLGREGRLREVGLLAVYLASAAADYMTGQTLYLDGGMTL